LSFRAAEGSPQAEKSKKTKEKKNKKRGKRLEIGVLKDFLEIGVVGDSKRYDFIGLLRF